MINTYQNRVTHDPNILAGKPTIRGMRISVEHIFRSLSSGIPEAEILQDYPDLEPEDIKACYAYAAGLIESERAFRIPEGMSA